MGSFPWLWSKKRAISAVIIAAVVSWVALLVLDYNKPKLMDRFNWPASGQLRIENMAQLTGETRQPASWCYPPKNSANLYAFDTGENETDLGRCLALIAPVSEFQETMPCCYIKRHYRAVIGNKFCEMTLSTVFENERIVGSDCYFGLFPKEKDTGVGITDDTFG